MEQQFTEERIALLKEDDDSAFSIGPIVCYLMQRETEARELPGAFCPKTVKRTRFILSVIGRRTFMSSEATKGSLAVIGDRESVMLFRVLGVQTVTAETAEDTARAIHRAGEGRLFGDLSH